MIILNEPVSVGEPKKLHSSGHFPVMRLSVGGDGEGEVVVRAGKG